MSAKLLTETPQRGTLRAQARSNSREGHIFKGSFYIDNEAWVCWMDGDDTKPERLLKFYELKEMEYLEFVPDVVQS